jgi:hypothetical protein
LGAAFTAPADASTIHAVPKEHVCPPDGCG